MITVTFALPEESRDFRRALRDPAPAEGGIRGLLSGESGATEIRVLHTGVGLVSAGKRITELLTKEKPRLLISSGYAGGLDPKLKIADLLVAANFSFPELAALCGNREQFAPVLHFGSLTSQTDAAESVADKASLFGSTGASGVDMETAAIATACAAARVPLLSVRAISDSASEPLPVPFEHWFDLKRQRPRPLGLVLYLARRPSKIAPFTRFVRGLTPARAAFTAFLIEVLGSKALREFVDRPQTSS